MINGGRNQLFARTSLLSGLVFQLSHQKAIQLVDEGMAVFFAEHRWTARHHASVSQLIQQVAQRQPVLDVVLRIKLAPIVKGKGPLGNHPVGKGDIGRYHQVSPLCQFNDVVIGNIRSFRDDDA